MEHAAVTKASAKGVTSMRGLGYALIIVGILSAVLIFLYPGLLGWSGLVGSVVAVLTGVGFLSYTGCGCTACRSVNYTCNCNRC